MLPNNHQSSLNSHMNKNTTTPTSSSPCLKFYVLYSISKPHYQCHSPPLHHHLLPLSPLPPLQTSPSKPQLLSLSPPEETAPVLQQWSEPKVEKITTPLWMSETMLLCRKSRVLIENLLERFDFYSFFWNGFWICCLFWFFWVVILMGRVWFLRKCVKCRELESGVLSFCEIYA